MTQINISLFAQFPEYHKLELIINHTTIKVLQLLKNRYIKPMFGKHSNLLKKLLFSQKLQHIHTMVGYNVKYYHLPTKQI